jgi:hypothetical protein
MRPGTTVFEQWDYGLPTCYLDLAVQLGLQYRLLHGVHGFFPRLELIEYLTEYMQAETDSLRDPRMVFEEAKEAMPMQHCCRTVIARCCACWTNSTEHAFCEKWNGKVPECPQHR